MENFNKQQIADRLQEYVNGHESQNKAANSLKAVSPATVSNILNGKWDNIKDEMWRNINAQIGGSNTDEWVLVETSGNRFLNRLLTDAQQHSNVFAVTGPAGSGKTATMKLFASKPNAYRIQCSDFWVRKNFLGDLLAAMGINNSGMSVAEMMHEVIRRLKQKDRPLLILDEADKLTDQVLYFFITLYNELEDHCGIVICATDHLKKRIKRGVDLNKKGYNEIYSRIGRKFIELPEVGNPDVSAICMANGITERKDILEVCKDSESDLRRVKRKIHALKQRANGN